MAISLHSGVWVGNRKRHLWVPDLFLEDKPTLYNTRTQRVRKAGDDGAKTQLMEH